MAPTSGTDSATMPRIDETAMPRVSFFMTSEPVTIAPDETLAVAHRLMRQHRIRHLPVIHHGKLVGMLSQRDLHWMEAIADTDPSRIRVADAMTVEPFVVSPDTPVDQVAATMAQQRYGSAVVMDGTRVVGIFTTTDALRALTTVLRNQRSEEPYEPLAWP